MGERKKVLKPQIIGDGQTPNLFVLNHYAAGEPGTPLAEHLQHLSTVPVLKRLRWVNYRLRAKWSGIYLLNDKKTLFLECGKRPPGHVLHDHHVSILNKGRHIETENGFAFPLAFEELPAGAVVFTFRNKKTASEKLMEAYAELISMEIENGWYSQACDFYVGREFERSFNNREQFSILMEMAAHDLTSPLNAVTGYLEMIDDSLIREEDLGLVKKYCKKIAVGVKDISAILNQFRDIRNLKKKEGNYKPVLTNINWLIKEIAELYSVTARNQKIALNYNIPAKPVFVHANVSKLKRSVMNLVSNAIKFTGENGEVKITLETKNKKACICVVDNGIGIPEEKQKEIFKPFIQVKKDARHNSPESIGLGLYITSNFIQQMNGTLSVDSKKGEGSCFTISLPIPPTA